MHEIKKKNTLEPQRLIYGFTKTLHRCPLVTINETFDISMKWSKMTIRKRLTAYFRTSDGSNVQIVNIIAKMNC